VLTDKPHKATILLGIIGRDAFINKPGKLNKLSLPDEAKEEGYLLKIFNDKIIVAAYTEAGLFYGVQTLKQLIKANADGDRLPCLSITDWPSLRYRGWMDDISRGPIPTMDFLKECIRKMAEYKQNYFTLYTEHVFKLREYPDIAPADGITAEQIEELTRYAADYHMEVIGNFQSFGHMAKILSIPFYEHLAENGDILNPANDSTYLFLDNVYKEIVPAYSSKFFNINCDETFGLGAGRSKAMADEIGVDGIYAYHINRIDKLIKPYGKRIMMWGDIAVNNPGIINRLPKDLIILSWGYHAAESFDDAILPFKQTGFDFMVAPGVSCWNEVWPGMMNAAINISNYVRDGYKLGAMGMMNTAWDDNGHNLFNANWHGLVWGAECSWNPAAPLTGEEAVTDRNRKLSAFNKCFDKLFFQTEGVTNLLFDIDSLRKIPVRGMLNEWAFWTDPLAFNTENTIEQAVLNNRKVLEKVDVFENHLNSILHGSPANKSMLLCADLALMRIAFTAQKNIALRELYKAGQTKDQFIIEEAKKHLSSLHHQLYNIKKVYVNLWALENRGWWLDKNLNDYDKLAEKIQSACDIVFIEPADHIADRMLPVTLSTIFDDSDIVYTTDGTDPLPGSAKYYQPILIEENTTIKACTVRDGVPGKTTSRFILYHNGIGSLYKLNSRYSTYNPAYTAGGDNGLLDGLKGSSSFSDGHWQGYQGQDLDIELDFKEEINISKVSVDFLQNAYSWILLPAEVEILVSEDGINYRPIAVIKHDIPQDRQGTVIHNFNVSFQDTSTRYLRLIARNPGLLPASHQAAGYPSYIFADEIIIE